ncbi:restriction endonuclease subunit S [Aeromonas hydrophila]|uniref:restriction endonuclease subunit S n=1 Tax=Aeromonas hydrophila TaxID=644 RepID=UPI0038D0F290
MAEQMKQEATGKAIPAGYKQTEVGVIPEDWGVKKGRELFTKIQDGTHFSPKISNGGFLYITSKNIKHGYLDLTSVAYIDKIQHEKIYKRCDVLKNDILLTKDGVNTGNVALNTLEQPFSLLSSVAFLRLDVREHNPVFFVQQILSGIFQSVVKDEMSGNAITRLTLGKINNLKFYVPMVQEQTAIANVLSDSDALIDALEQLIAKKQAIKSATMQQLLTGRTRLPAFALRPDGTPKGYKPSELGEIPEDWEVDFLGNISAIIRNGSNYKTVSKDGVAVTRIETIADGFIDLNRTGFASIESINGSYKVLRGDILYSHINSIDHIGKVAIFDGGSLLFHGINLVLIRSSSVIDPFWLFNFLSGEVARKWAKQVAKQAVSQASINTKELKSLLLAVPSIQEQTAIATILSDMDNELQALTQKLEKARALKQGMMQQLLTGKIRLPLAAGA